MSSEPTNKIDKICSEPKCKKPLRIRGFCVACYYRHLRCGDIKKGVKPVKWKHILSEIDTVNKTAICKECGPIKILKRDNKTWRCSKIANERSKLYKRAYRASKRSIMGDNCEICNTDKKLCYDHSHKTNKYRGTLCSECNLAIGLMHDNPDRLRKAAKYLDRFVNDKSSKL